MIDTRGLIIDQFDLWTSAIEKKSAAGRGSGASHSLHGVQQLRDLIIHLAVGGALQNNRAIKSIDNDWRDGNLGSYFTFEYGKNLPQKKRSESGEFPVYGSNGIVGTHRESLVDGSCIVIGRKGSAGALNVSNGEGCWVTDVAYFCIPPRDIEVDFAFLLFSSLKFDQLGKGIKPGLNRNDAYALSVKIPPLPVQRSIVSKVDELMALCDALEQKAEDSLIAHQTLVKTLLGTLTNSQSPEELSKNWARVSEHFDNLFTNEESIESLERTIFALAVMGKLDVQDFREERTNQEHLRPDDIAEKYDHKSFVSRSDAFPLPLGWSIEPLSRVCQNIVDCPHTTPKWEDSGVLCIKSSQVRPTGLKLDKPSYVSEATYVARIERLEPTENDILYIREGGILGVAARVPRNTRLCLGQRLMLMRANASVVPAYLELVLNSRWITEYAKLKTTGGAAPRINMDIVRGYPIPIPPLAEQKRIVSKVRNLLQLCDELRANLANETALKLAMSDIATNSVAA